MEFQEILHAEDEPVGMIRLERPDDGNKRDLVAWARGGHIPLTPRRACGANNPA